MSAAKLAGRDALVLAVTLAAWHWALPAAGGGASVAISVLLAAMTVLCGFLVHEWGHLLGARLLRARVHFPDSLLASPFLFRFDTSVNNARQFCAMSLGGFVASGLVVLALILWLPHGHLATTLALVLSGLGVLATLVIEFPEFWRVLRGAPLPAGAAYVSSDASSDSR